MKRLLFILLPLALFFSCSREQGELPENALYQSYATRPELKVAQVSGLKLIDTVRVDVVLLQAENDSVWQQLTGEFGVDDSTGVTSWLGGPEQPATRVRWEGRPVLRVIASPERQSIGLYSIESEAQYDALLDYQLNNMH